MINNNTTQIPPQNTGTVSDSSIYLKKSELPKNVGAFENDKGYISSTSLEVWMLKHSYISKPEVEKLIKKANLEVIDIVNKSSDGEAINRLDDYIKEINREIVEIKDRLNTLSNNDISDVNKRIDKIDSDIKNINNQSGNYLTEHQSLEGYATEQWVKDRNYLTEHQSLKDYVRKTDLNSTLANYAKKDDVYAKTSVDNILTNYLKKTDASKQYPSKTEVSRTYITKTDANSSFLRIEDYRGIKDAATINDEYKYKTRTDLEKDIEGLMNGFYIVNNSDIVIIKDHKILNIFKDGSPQVSLSWVEVK